MSAWRSLRAGIQLGAQHPGAVLWYLRSRLRQLALPWEQRDPAGGASPPRFLTLKPTLRCNLRCEFCRFVANGDVFGKRDWLEMEDWRRVVDQAAPHRPYFCLTGGEPTLFPQIGELVAHIKGKGLLCVLTTNGTLLEHRAEALMQSPPDAVVLSVDGPREVHDRVRQVDGTYERALRGIRKLESLRRGPLPYLVVNAAITGQTVESAIRLVEVAREFGAFALHFQHFWFLTRPMVDAHNRRWGDCFPLDYERVGGTATTGVDTEQLWETIQELKRRDWGLPVVFYPELSREELEVYYTQPERLTHRMVPSCAWISTDILPNGDVSPCFDLVVGNVLRQSLDEIWNGPEMRAHRQRLQGGPYPVCARCCAYFRKD